MNKNQNNHLNYWEKYYKTKSNSVPIPSQFAAFALQESDGANLIIDIGCGSGRDTIFFAKYGRDVIGLDGSHSAIEACKQNAEFFNVDPSIFRQCRIANDDLSVQISSYLKERTANKIMVYARFFLHAITESDEDELLDFLSKTLCAEDILAIEYRTVRDAYLKKETGDHFRRYIEPTQLNLKLHQLGFSIKYSVEGFGFAKYKNDDSYSCRCIAQKK